MEIRPFLIGDLDAVARLWRDSWRSTGLAKTDDPTVEQNRERLLGEGLRDWTLLVACVAGEVAGFMAYDAVESHLRQLFVSPKAKRSGIGTELLRRAKAAMPGGFFLRVDPGNIVARQFYASCGMIFDREAPHPTRGAMMAIYRWR